MSSTAHFGWKAIPTGGDPTEDSNQFFDGDRHSMDAIVAALLDHHHTGAVASDDTPVTALSLEVLTDAGGVIRAGLRIWYRYSLVDVNGLETAASPEAFVDTPAAILAPGAPAGITYATTGGTLLPGGYYYRLSAYVGESTIETRPSAPASISVAAGSSTNAITFTLPSVPAGATGFNVYRRKPGGDYAYLTTIDMSVVTPPTTFEDDGSIVDDCVRHLPQVNRTGGQNAVEINLPGATPTVPEGYTWRLYRTYQSGDWSNSRIADVVEETSEGSGIITPTYTDLGQAALGGEPRESTQLVDMPDRVDLNDAAEVQNVLPPANVVYPWVVEFQFAGPIEEVIGTFKWRCPFYRAYIREVLINTGIDAAPVVDDLIVDVNKLDNQVATPDWNTIFTTQANRPRVVVGDEVGDPAVPDVQLLWRDDFLSVDVDQAGGGATPGDSDLLVQILMWIIEDEGLSIDVFN